MSHLKALVMMQLKDKLDFDFLASKRTVISKIVFTVLKFLAVTAAAYSGRFIRPSILKEAAPV